jgi:hypothetical protein
VKLTPHKHLFSGSRNDDSVSSQIQTLANVTVKGILGSAWLPDGIIISLAPHNLFFGRLDCALAS